MKLGRRAIAGIVAGSKAASYWDSDLAGFGLRVLTSGKASWICGFRAGTGGRGAVRRRLTLGTADESITPEAARSAARDVLARVRLGANPAAKQAEERAGETATDKARPYCFGIHGRRKIRTGATEEEVRLGYRVTEEVSEDDLV